MVMPRGYGTSLAEARCGLAVVEPPSPPVSSHDPLHRDHLHLGVRPDEPLHRVEHAVTWPGRPRHGGEPELAALPLVLVTDLGGSHLEPGRGPPRRGA